MTQEQIEQYTAQNEPTTVNRCPTSRRWETRLWNVTDGEVLKMETFKNEEMTVDEIALVGGVIVETSNYSKGADTPQAYESITGRTYEFKAN